MLIYLIINDLIIIFSILLTVSFFTLFERKFLAGLQRRHGPVYTGFLGLLQPFADGLKLLSKEINEAQGSHVILFLFGSILSFNVSLLYWVFIPFNSFSDVADVNFSILFIFGISSVSSYVIMLSGWVSASRYAILGAIRASAQMISYEIPLTLSVVPILVSNGSCSFFDIIDQQIEIWNFLSFTSCSFIFFLCILAETNRAPFDLPEAESELVAGYNVEYSSIFFAFFFLAEYSSMIAFSSIFVILFLGGWFLIPWNDFFFFNVISLLEFFKDNFKLIIFESSFFWVKTVFICMIFVLIRGILPRFTYSHLISLCWKSIIPLVCTFILYNFDICLFHDFLNFFYGYVLNQIFLILETLWILIFCLFFYVFSKTEKHTN